jgi:hypothetical protein
MHFGWDYRVALFVDYYVEVKKRLFFIGVIRFEECMSRSGMGLKNIEI